MDFDKAVHSTGYGKFHYEVFTACAICVMSVGFQNGLSAYIFPAAQCELDLTSFQLSILNVSFLVGGVVSSFLWGAVADHKGRKAVLVLAHFLNGSITIICAVSPYVYSIIICRFFNGFLIGGPGSIIFSYLAEFQPVKYRSSIICYSGIFFTFSWLLLPVFAWFILPFDISLLLPPIFILTSWRLFFIILAIPELLVGFWFLRLPESPKFFLAKGNTQMALEVLQKMFSRNTGRHPKEFPVKSLLSDIRSSENGKKRNILGDMWTELTSLFQPPLLFLTILTTSIMFSNMFGVFGLGWWLPELFIRFQRFHALHPNESVTVKELALLNDVTDNCQPSFDNAVIQSTIIMGLTSLLANALSGYLAGKVSMKIIACSTMLLGGLCASTIYWLDAPWQNLLVASIFQACMITANMTIGGIVVELFPTGICAIAICVTMCAGRLGAAASNIVFGLFMDKHCEIPIFVVAVSVVIGAALCFFIPKGKTGDTCIQNQVEVAVISVDTKL